MECSVRACWEQLPKATGRSRNLGFIPSLNSSTHPPVLARPFPIGKAESDAAPADAAIYPLPSLPLGHLLFPLARRSTCRRPPTSSPPYTYPQHLLSHTYDNARRILRTPSAPAIQPVHRQRRYHLRPRLVRTSPSSPVTLGKARVTVSKPVTREGIRRLSSFCTSDALVSIQNRPCRPGREWLRGGRCHVREEGQAKA